MIVVLASSTSGCRHGQGGSDQGFQVGIPINDLVIGMASLAETEEHRTVP